MLEGFRSDDLLTMLTRLKSDGTGLSTGQAARFLDLIRDDDLRPLVDPTIWSEAQRLAPMVREHLFRSVPAVG